MSQVLGSLANLVTGRVSRSFSVLVCYLWTYANANLV